MRNFFKKLGIFIVNKKLLVAAIGIALAAASVFGALRLYTAFDNSTFVNPDSRVYRDYTRFTRSFSSDVVVVLVSADDLSQLLQPQNLNSMAAIENLVGAVPGVVSAISPAFYLEQAMARQTGTAVLPQDMAVVQGIVLDPQTGQIRSQLKSILPDDKHALIAVTLDGGLSQAEQKTIVNDVENAVSNAGFMQAETIVTGLPVIKANILNLLTTNLIYMFIVAIALMLVILVLVFSVRGFFAWRWLPLCVVLIAIVYMFGAMGWLNIPITIVSMAVFPIVIGLGVDYAIQFHNRYDEESGRNETINAAIINSVTHIGPAIGIAIVAACLGFVALFFSPVPMVKDFGYMLIIGVIACYLVSMFILLVILYRRDQRHAVKTAKAGERAEKEKVSRMETALKKMANWVIKSPAVILPIALVLTVGGLVTDSHIGTLTEWSEYLSPDLTVIKDYHTLESVAGGSSSVNLLVEAKDIADPAVLQWMAQLEQKITAEQAAKVGSINSVTDLVLQATGGQLPQDSQQIRQLFAAMPAPIMKNLVNNDYTAANIVVNAKEAGIDSVKDLQNNVLPEYIASPPAGVTVTVTGGSMIQVALLDALSSGRERMTIIGIIFVFAGLFLLFKLNIIKALLAIIPIGLIIGWSSGFMFVMGIEYTPITATLGSLIMGIGVEFTVLLMMRYYEEREKGESPVEAMKIAMTRIGRAIIASGLTVIGGFAALLIAKDFTILRDFGIVTLVDVFFALVSTLFVLPSLIVWFDTWRQKRRAH